MTETLSMDEAHKQLLAVDDESQPSETIEAEQPADETQAVEAIEDSEGQPEPDDSAIEPEGVNDAQEQELEAVQPSIEPPTFWKAEAKEAFAKMPPELQQIIADTEKTRQADTTQAQAQAAERAREAEAKLAETTAYFERVDSVIETAQKTFKSRWEDVDWAAWAETNPAEYVQAKALYEKEQAEMQRLNGVKQDADQKRYQEHITVEGAKLAEILPDFTDPEKGPALKSELQAYLSKEAGVTPEQLKWMKAKELSIAHKAMMYDKAQARVNSPEPKPKPKAIKTARGAVSHPNSTISKLQKRFNATSSIDDAAALLLAMESQT